MKVELLKSGGRGIELLAVNNPWSVRALALSIFCSFLCFMPLANAGGSVRAWGLNNDGQCDVPAGLSNVVAIAGGGMHTLALRGDGTVAVWGWNLLGEKNVPSGLNNVIAIAANYGYCLALRSDGTVAGWGTASNNVPADLSNVVALAAGADHALALRSDGTVVSWGNEYEPPAPVTNIIGIAAGNGHSLALRADGKVVAWGNNTSNKTNVPGSLANVVAIAAGDHHNLALKSDGTITAWGDNTFGQRTVPAAATNVVAIAAGSAHSLALKADGTVVVWGRNDSGQATPPPFLTGVVGISGGQYHSVALVGDGSPVIITPPMNQSAVLTKTATFSVLAAGSLPLSYQWYREDFKLAGATKSSLQLTNIQLSDGTFYQVVVSNRFGSVTSAPAFLTPIGIPPWIVTQPSDSTILCGENAQFRVTADGPPALAYQWLFGDMLLPDATNATLTLTEVMTNQAGFYSVIVANSYGSITSRLATLTVVPPSFVTQPQDLNPICGETAIFTTVVAGKAPFSYQWFFEGSPIAGATNATLTIRPVTRNSGGLYVAVASNICCAFASREALLTVTVEPPEITSPLTATGSQGTPFTYTITARHNPSVFSAVGLPAGLTVDGTNGLITGVPLQSGYFKVRLGVATDCASDSKTLELTITSSAPAITSPLLAYGEEGTDFTYQIMANNSPTSFGAANLPQGLWVDPATGLISGKPVYPGDFDATIAATNAWGAGTALLHFTFTNRTITGLAIADVTYNYSSPYLLDFQFSLRDNEDPALGSAVVVNPTNLIVNCMENGRTNSSSETAYVLAPGRGIRKLVKANLVLDFTESIASLSNGDTNADGTSDAVDMMVIGARSFVDQLVQGSQVGVYEFHREDVAPQKVIDLTADKAAVKNAIAGIWTNYVGGFPAASRCWDALVAAINGLGASNMDEQHYVVFISDGRDESSTATVDDIITAATDNNVRIYCVGFGAELDPTDLVAITSATSGRYLEATNVAGLASELAQISKDIAGQYVLRWATLKRGATPFMPSFEIFYGTNYAHSPTNPVWTDFDNPTITTNDNGTVETNYPLVTNYIIGWYTPSQFSNDVTVGSLRLVSDAQEQANVVTLRATYVPRFIRQLRLHYRPNWPCSVKLLSSAPGEILQHWTLSETNDGAGGTWLLLSAAYPQSTTNSIPYGAFGSLLNFTFRDMRGASNAFSLFEVDNTIYTNTGRQRFVVATNGFVTAYPVLPYGTPVPWLIAHGFSGNYTNAEISDPDLDGALTWMEYQADTDPRDPNSKFAVQPPATTGLYGHYQVIFNTSVNRTYRLEASEDLLAWEILVDNIPGTGGTVAATDPRSPWNSPQMYYRVVAW